MKKLEIHPMKLKLFKIKDFFTNYDEGDTVDIEPCFNKILPYTRDRSNKGIVTKITRHDEPIINEKNNRYLHITTSTGEKIFMKSVYMKHIKPEEKLLIDERS